LLQLALVRLLKSWGITPAAVTGHSSGEISAAYAAGALTFREALAVAYIRGKLTWDFVSSGKARGGMTAVAASREKVMEYFQTAKTGTSVAVACVNSPESVTISGKVDCLKNIEKLATADGVMFRRLKVPAAYHSSEMDYLTDDYATWLKPHFETSHPRNFIANFSSPVTGGLVSDPATIHDPRHWVKNMVQPVLFGDCLPAMIMGNESPNAKSTSPSVDVILEIGPHGALQGPIRQILDGMKLQSLKPNVGTCLKRGEDAVQKMQETASMLYCRGCQVDLKKVNFPLEQASPEVVVDLPVYQWNHAAKFWDAPQVTTEYNQREFPPHDLLGTRVEGLNPEQAVWRNMLRISNLPWLQHHIVQSEILYPAAGMMSMVVEALRQLDITENKTSKGYVLSDIDLINAVIIPNTQDAVEIQLVVRDSSSGPDGSKDFVFYSRQHGGNWTRNCQGKVSTAAESPEPMPQKKCGLLPVGISHFYDFVERTGPTLGPTFRNVMELAGGNGGSEAVIRIHDTAAMMPATHQSDCVVHPTTLDACFHPAWAALPEAIAHKLGLSVPRTIRNLFVNSNMPSAPGSELGLTTSIENASHDEFTVSISVLDLKDPNRVPVIKIDGLKLVSIAPNPGTSPEDELMLLHTVWQPSLNYMSQGDLQKRITEAPSASEVLVFAELQKATVNVIHDILEQITPELEESLHWYHKKYVTWMREQDQALYAAYKVQDERAKFELYSRVTPSCVNGRMLDLVAKNLLKFLRKEADPLEVMAQDGFLSEYYANMIKLTRCLNHVEKYMTLFAHQNPGARILEIGAGTGSCTEPALKGLSQDNTEAPLMVEKYVFTDVSAGFFEAAGKRFAPYASQMQFQKLDIEREPSSQGFVEGEYDLIISCNCLHATSSLKKTMDNVRKLLKPGGKLLLVETTTPHVDQSLTFGLFSGWWLSEEEERKSSPLLSAPAWSRFLADSNFSGVDVALGDAGSPEVSNYSAMVATAVENPMVNGYTIGKKVALTKFPPSAEVPSEWLQSLNDTLNDYLEGGEAYIVDAGKPLPSDTWCACVLAFGDEPFSSLSSADFDNLKSTLLGTEKTLWVSRGASLSTASPAAALATGLLRTLRMEQGADRFTSLDLDSEQDVWQSNTADAIRDVLRGMIRPADKDAQEYELVHRSGAIMVPRYQRNTALIREAKSLQLGEPVDVSSSFPCPALSAAVHSNAFHQGLSQLDDLRFDQNAAYLVLGGLTGVGRELVRWMASVGAKNIILISRSASQESTRDMQDELQEYGCRLIPSSCDIANKRDLKNLIDMCRAFTPIRGVVQSALMLDDSSFANMTHEQWEAPMAAKYHGTRNLDELFQGPTDLDFFIMLSSVTGVLGSHGQANYTAGSTYQDALARRRVANGLPGVAIDLGSVLGAGFVARTHRVAERAAKAGWRAHTVAEALRLVELAMRHPRQPELLAGVAAWRARAPEPLPWRHEPRFLGLPIRRTGDGGGGAEKDRAAASLKDQLKQQQPDAEAAVPVLVEALTVRLAEMFVLSPADINAAQPLSALGVDSLVAVELRNWLSANVVANVTIFDVTQSSSLVELAEKVAAKFLQA
jgi:acyl transferase domain-containing protein/NAD(P)-dependent dehydrogenase (short-subunit alcohol dehydrogenase family)